MLNGRIVLFGILCVLFVAAAFGQEQSDPNIITVTERINIANLNNNVKELGDAVKKLTEITEKLSGNVEKLTESVNSLNTRVAVLEERTQGTAKTVHVILASFIGPLIVAILAAIIISLITHNRNSKGKTAATNTTQVNPSEANPTQVLQNTASDTDFINPAQVGKGDATSTSTAASRFPEGEELKEYLKSDSFTTKEPV
jgi:prophage DNA circulation protein